MQDAADPKEQCTPCIEDGEPLEGWSVMTLQDGSCSEMTAAMVLFLQTSEWYLAH